MCVRYCEEFGWGSREESKEVVVYVGNDQQTGWTREVEKGKNEEERNKEIQMAEERIRKSHREGQERVYWQHMWQDHETLRFNVHEDKSSRLEKSRGIRNIDIEDYQKTSETSTENLGELCYRDLQSAWSAWLTKNLEVGPEKDVDADEKGPLYFASWNGKNYQGDE